MFVDPWGLEDIVVAGGAYHQGEGDYQYEFIDSALLQIYNMNNNATLLVADAGWTQTQRDAIVEVATERGINMLWFSNIDSLTNYINYGRDRTKDPITSFYVFAHGTDNGTGYYAITFGLYTEKNSELSWYTSDISRINDSAFAEINESKFYACRTGNDFDNDNFAQTWADKTGGNTYAYRGSFNSVGRSDYANILGTWWERHFSRNDVFKNWKQNRGDIATKPGQAWRLPQGSYLTEWVLFN